MDGERGFAPVETLKNNEEWITAAEALRLLTPVFGSAYEAKLTICRRAHAGLIRARAQHFMIGDRSTRDQEVPKQFWLAEGHAERFDSTCLETSQVLVAPPRETGKSLPAR
jgi:hypothetical protein